jgi:hypothetical protein
MKFTTINEKKKLLNLIMKSIFNLNNESINKRQLYLKVNMESVLIKFDENK